MDKVEPLRRPRVARIAVGGDTFDVLLEFEEAVQTALPGYGFSFDEGNGSIAIPASDTVMFDGRFLREEEQEAFEATVRAAIARIPDATSLYAFEELYLFDWNQFDDSAFKRLERAYATMPGWIAGRSFPTWFSADESEPHVWASVEPPGLLVNALLDRVTFIDWSAAFLERTNDLPFRTDD